MGKDYSVHERFPDPQLLRPVLAELPYGHWQAGKQINSFLYWT